LAALLGEEVTDRVGRMAGISLHALGNDICPFVQRKQSMMELLAEAEQEE